MQKSKQLAIFAFGINLKTHPIQSDMITKETIGKATVISFTGINKLNVTATQKVKADVVASITQQSNIVLDLSNIIYIDSTGFGMLLSMLRHCKHNEATLKLCNISPEVMELIKLLQLQHVFDIKETVQDCIDSNSNLI